MMSEKPRVVNLRCEYHVNPLGIGVSQPRLSWAMQGSGRGVVQSAYQIRVECDDYIVWDTSKVASDRSTYVPYGGDALVSEGHYLWQVRIWDGAGRMSEWSEPAWWEMGLLEASDWRAHWIEPPWEPDRKAFKPCPYFRQTFDVDGRVRAARATVTSYGLYELYLNGHVVGDQVFTPGFTSYHDRLQVQVHDVGQLLLLRENALGAILGDGWYRGKVSARSERNIYGNKLALLVQVHIWYEDGREQWVVSNGDWRVTTGPILKSDLKDGEAYDARLEMPGWCEAGFDDSGWQGAVLAKRGLDNLVPSVGPPVRRKDRFHPVAILHTPNGETVLDMGQNLAGRMRMRVSGPEGTTVKLTHGEALDKEGNFTLEHLQLPRMKVEQETSYTLRGGGEQEYEPRFTVHGFRYVKVEGYPGTPTADDFEAIAIYSDMPPAGTFSCSDERVNQLQHNIEWSMKGNFLDIPTDCPTRERAGSTGDAQVFGDTASFLMDTASFFRKWLQDLAVDQAADVDACVPHWVPDTTRYSKRGPIPAGSAGWGDAAVILPWTLYLCTGDRAFLEEQYESMVAWVEYERKNAQNVHWRKKLNPAYWLDAERRARQPYIWDTKYHWGEWLELGKGAGPAMVWGMLSRILFSVPLVATAYYAYSTALLAQAAEVLGKENDATRYGNLARLIREAYASEFIGPEGQIKPDKQASYVLALALDLVPDALRTTIAERLVGLIRAANNHLDTGLLSTPFLCHVLTEMGYLDVAYDLLLQETPPSWLYAVTKGATTVWERWEGITPAGEPHGSLNHYSHGAVGSWLYRTVAGIGIGTPGYKHIRIDPHPGGGLTRARATYRCPYGEIVSGWTIEGDKMQMEVVIPPNTTATLRLPGVTLEQVMEGGIPLSGAPGVTQAMQENTAVVAEVGSGRYELVYPYQN